MKVKLNDNNCCIVFTDGDILNKEIEITTNNLNNITLSKKQAKKLSSEISSVLDSENFYSNGKINIEVQKIIYNCEEYYRILRLNCKEKKDLPIEYFNSKTEAYVYLDSEKENFLNIEAFKGNRNQLELFNIPIISLNDTFLIEGFIFKKENLEKILKYLEECSKRLSRIMDNINSDNWNGVEEYNL